MKISTRWHASARTFACVAIALTVLALGACGGSDPAPPPPGGNDPPPPPVSQDPSASFTAPAAAAANSAISFDASASAAADGSALAAYSWDFGNGRRAGGRVVSQVFTDGGSHVVTLTVADAQGRTAQRSKTIDIAPPAAAPRSATATGSIVSVAGTALEGVSAAVVGSDTTATSDALGKLSISLGVDIPVVLKLSKEGYADQRVVLRVPATVGNDAHFEARMLPREAARTLADAGAGGTVGGKDGASVQLPANSLVLPSGAVATGPVQIAMTPVDVTLPGGGGFPGSFSGSTPAAAMTPIVSFGTTEFVLQGGGEPLQLAAGKSAIVDLPLYANSHLVGTRLQPGDTLPLWSLDERSGLWVNEGTGTVVAAASAPTGLALRATVTHFSWWNADFGFDPYNPRPRCVYDTDIGLPGGEDHFATATICNLLGEIDRGLDDAPAAVARAIAAGDRNPAADVPLRVPAYAARTVIPIAGGVPVSVPPTVNVVLSAEALNGTWKGRTVVNGPPGGGGEVLIRMRPIDNTGLGEVIALPYDHVSSLDTGQTALYHFAGTAGKWVRATVTRANGSNLGGRVRLLRAGVELAAADFGASPGQLLYNLPDAGQTYTIEATGTANTPGAYRLQVELLGDTQEEPLALPIDLHRALPAFTVYRGTLSVAARMPLSIAFARSSGGALIMRVRSSDGSLLTTVDLPVLVDKQTPTLLLPAAGVYTFEIMSRNGQAAGFALSADATAWLRPDNGSLPAESNDDLVDLIADRNGAPVVIVSQRTTAQSGGYVGSIALRRWNGTGWSDVAPAVPDYARPCTGSGSIVSATFDLDNAPVVAFGENTAAGGTEVVVRRYRGGAWQPVGVDDGKLPRPATFSGSCHSTPALRIGADNNPVIAFEGDNAVWTLRFDGTQWRGFATDGGDSFAGLNPTYDLQLDPGGQWVLVVSTADVVTVRRFDATGSHWETVGPNSGALPAPAGTRGYYAPHLRFDGAGHPVIGAMAWVDTQPGVFTGGVAVLRFDGAAWQTQGGYRLSNDSFSNYSIDMGFTLFHGDAVMGFVSAANGIARAVVQVNTPAGWSPLGPAADGAVGLAGSNGWTLRPLAIGDDLYLALVERPVLGPAAIRLLRYVP